ncbi:hypothetical protein ACQPZP_25500 [Spirillospora sp. CA-142024]|uniref:hypothetical protein n=1 Tax=Spirillospora sp. CA-142024 TaxID=3240036 RepID=UPI003D89EBC6
MSFILLEEESVAAATPPIDEFDALVSALETEPLQVPATMAAECPGGGRHNLQPYTRGGVTYYKCSKCDLDTGAK